MNQPGKIQPRTGLGKELKLVWKLIGNKRVPFLLKLLPLGAAVYLIIPTDFLPGNPIDDAIVIWAGLTLFVELAPDDVVKEIRNSIGSE